MMKTELKSTRIFNWLSALLILVMIVMLFTPYWSYTDKIKNEETGKREEVTKVVSISGYVWLLRDHKGLTEDFDKVYKEINEKNGAVKKENKVQFKINDVVLMPVLLLLLGVALGIISLKYGKLPLTSALAAGLGIQWL